MKKKINVMLILVVLGLWGTVGYRTIFKYFAPEETTKDNLSVNSNIAFKKFEKDTFQLGRFSRDPFLNTSSGNSAKTYVPQKNTTHSTTKPILAKKTEKPIQPPIVQKEIVIWPSITYHGYIKSKDKEDITALLKINSRLCRLKKNEQYEGITLTRIKRDTIELTYKKQKRFVTSS